MQGGTWAASTRKWRNRTGFLHTHPSVHPSTCTHLVPPASGDSGARRRANLEQAINPFMDDNNIAFQRYQVVEPECLRC